MGDRDAGRLYRFAPLDRTGWILGLSAPQCGLIGVTIFAASMAAQAEAAPLILLVIIVAGLTVTFATWAGQPAHDWLPLLAQHAFARTTGRQHWRAPLRQRPHTIATDLALPPFLSGLRIVDAGETSWMAGPVPLGVIFDDRAHTLAATLRLSGRGFALSERDEQDRLVQLWGETLASACVERSPVVGLRVLEWAAPGGSGDHEQFAAHHAADTADASAVANYTELLRHAGPAATAHDTLLTVTIDSRRVRTGAGRPREQAAIETVGNELRRLAVRLDAAGLQTSAPLSARQLASVLRLRCDPTAARRLATRAQSLAEATGLVSLGNAGPMATEVEWNRLRLDGALHRIYWVAEWPRLDVAAGWLEPLLLHAGGTRTIAIHYEPVPPSRARRHIERDATRLATDEAQRERSGFRIGARHRRAQTAVLEREAEMVAGHAELEFAGFVAVTAADENGLDTACATYEQAAAQAGIELRPVDGRHDRAFVCALPVPRGLTPRRFA